jgi:hypothetical protein
LHRIRDRLDQRRGIGVEVERDGADHSCLMGKAGNGEVAIAMTAISCALPLSRSP